MKIIGIRPSSFTGDDKTEISGKNIYLTYPLEKGEGQGSERVFITDANRQIGFECIRGSYHSTKRRAFRPMNNP